MHTNIVLFYKTIYAESKEIGSETLNDSDQK